MQQLLVVAVVVGALVALALGLFAVRVLSLVRTRGTFDCSWRPVLPPPVADSRGERAGPWTLGVARVGREDVEWWRVFSLSPRPRSTWCRSALEVQGRRPLGPGDSGRLVAGSVVVRCCQRLPEVRRGIDARPGPGARPRLDARSGESFELAMTPDAYTGFASWLESSPPHGRGSVT